MTCQRAPSGWFPNLTQAYVMDEYELGVCVALALEGEALDFGPLIDAMVLADFEEADNQHMKENTA